jgi:hypothetical protein
MSVDPASLLVGVEAVEELVGLEAVEVEPMVDLVAVDIYMYPRTMVQAEEHMALAMEVEAVSEAVGMEVTTPRLRRTPTDMAAVVVVDFKLPEKVAS